MSFFEEARVSEPEVKVPKKFYRYRSMKPEAQLSVERTLFHNELRLAPASGFNDPFDMRGVFTQGAAPEVQREECLRLSRKFKPGLTEAQRKIEADEMMMSLSPDCIEAKTQLMQMMCNQLFTTTVGVLCLSETSEEILMWSHYGDCHQGICLEFDGHFNLMAEAQQVRYEESRPLIDIHVDSNDVVLQKHFLTKARHWEYEKEWRVIRDGGVGVVTFPPEMLTGIIIGAHASRSTLETVVRWWRECPQPIKLYKASPSRTEFKLDIVPCPGISR